MHAPHPEQPQEERFGLEVAACDSNSRYGEMTILAKANPGSPSLSQVAIRRSGGKPEAK